MFGPFRVFLRRLFGRTRFERELTDELQLHVETRVEDLVRRGIDPGEARRRARLEFGGVEQYKERVRLATSRNLVRRTNVQRPVRAKGLRSDCPWFQPDLRVQRRQHDSRSGRAWLAPGTPLRRYERGITRAARPEPRRA